MSDLNFVLSRIELGTKVRIVMDFYGNKAVLMDRRWLPGRQRVKLAPAEMDRVIEALEERRRRRVKTAA